MYLESVAQMSNSATAIVIIIDEKMQVNVVPPNFTLDKTLCIKLFDSKSKVYTIVAAGDEVDIDDDGDVIVTAKHGDNSTGAGQCSAVSMQS